MGNRCVLKLELIMQRLGACREPCFTLAELGSQENPLIHFHILCYDRERTMGPCPECGRMGEIVDGDVWCIEHGYVQPKADELSLYQLNDHGIVETLSRLIGGSPARVVCAGLWQIGNYHGQKLFYARRVTNDICSATHADPANALIFTVMPPDITNVRWTNKVLTLQEVFTLTTTDLAIQWDILERVAPPLKGKPPQPTKRQEALALRCIRWLEFVLACLEEIQTARADTCSMVVPNPKVFTAWMKRVHPSESVPDPRTLFRDLKHLKDPKSLFYSQEFTFLLGHWDLKNLCNYDRERIAARIADNGARLKASGKCRYNDNIAYDGR